MVNLRALLGSDARTILMRKNIIFSFLIKGWTGVVLYLLVPLTLKCLGEYENGLWLTISSLLLWIEQMDIGLGNGLRNELAAAIAHNNLQKAKEAVSSTFAMLTIIMIPVIVLLLGLTNIFDVFSFLNVDSQIVPNLRSIISAVVVLFCSSFILKNIGNVYMAMQLPAMSNAMIAIGQTLILIGTTILYYSNIHSLFAIAIINTASPLIVYLIACPLTFFWKFKQIRPAFNYININESKKLIGKGIQFFVLQIAGVVLFMSSNLLISRLFTPAMVTPYQIVYRYFTIILIIFGIISTPYWSATTDAFERNDKQWIIDSGKQLDKTVLFICFGIVIMILLSNPVYRIWISKDIEIPIPMTIAMASYIATLVISLRYSCILNGWGKLKLQLIFTLGASISYIPLSILAVNYYNNIISLIAVMCLVNIPGLIVNRLQYNKLIKDKAKGIWNK